MRDVINLAEKRGIAINWEQWATMRELRNILTHEYPQEEEEITKTLNKVKKKWFLNLIKCRGRDSNPHGVNPQRIS